MRTYPIPFATLKTFKNTPIDLFQKGSRGYRLFFKAGTQRDEIVNAKRHVPDTLYARSEDFSLLMGYPIDVAKTPLGKKYLIAPEERSLAYQKATDSLLLMSKMGVPAHELNECWEIIFPTMVLCFSREDIAPQFEPLLFDIPLTFAQGVQSAIIAVFLCSQIGINNRADLEEVALACLLQYVGVAHLPLEARNRKIDQITPQNFEVFIEKFESSQKIVQKLAVTQWVKYIVGRLMSTEHLSDKGNKDEKRIKHWIVTLALDAITTQLPPGSKEPKMTFRELFFKYSKSEKIRYPSFLLEMIFEGLHYYDRKAS